MKQLLLMLFTVLAFAACDNGENGDDTQSIKLAPGTSLSQTVYADETGAGGEGIKFAATSAWNATVNEVATKAGGSNADWINLSAYEGGAGDFTLKITLLPNNTGSTRKAIIKIVCGDTAITITVEQKGTTESGEKPSEALRLVSKVVETYKSNKEESYGEYTFMYDSQKRVIAINHTINNLPESKFLDKYTWEYGQSKIIAKQIFQESGGGSTMYIDVTDETYYLNADGTVKNMEGKRVSKHGETVKSISEYKNAMTYTDGYLSKQDFSEKEFRFNPDITGVAGGETAFIWKDGNLIKMNSEGDNVWENVFEYGDAYDKKCNVDFNWVLNDNDFECTMVPLNLGVRSKGLVSKATLDEGFTSEPLSNRTATKQYSYCHYTYEYDAKGYVSKITIKETESSSSYQSTTVYTITYVD